MDPLTMSLTSAVLTQGISFLYGQAGDALRWWRERKVAGDSAADQSHQSSAEIPPLFEGRLAPLVIHSDGMDTLEQDLKELRRALADYADGIETIDPKNVALLTATDALRRAMEAVYQQRLTFLGEARPPSGPLVEGHIEIEEVAGYAR